MKKLEMSTNSSMSFHWLFQIWKKMIRNETTTKIDDPHVPKMESVATHKMTNIFLCCLSSVKNWIERKKHTLHTPNLFVESLKNIVLGMMTKLVFSTYISMKHCNFLFWEIFNWKFNEFFKPKLFDTENRDDDGGAQNTLTKYVFCFFVRCFWIYLSHCLLNLIFSN